jgi:hypothetical protein
VGVLGAIVESLVGAVFDIRHDSALGGAVGPQLVGDNALWSASLFSQKSRQQAFRGFCVAARLNNFVEDVSVLINGAPEIARLAIDGDDDLVEMPNVVAAWPLSLQAPGVVGAEFDRPTSNRFVGDDNAALKQHFLDQAQAQRKTEIEPDCVCDDLRWEAMTFVADWRQVHAQSTTRPIAHSRLT